MYPGYIKVNLPIDLENFISGNGEGVWVKVEPSVERLYKDDFDGGTFTGILENDSCYFPILKCGDKIIFTMRGVCRPVAIYNGFLDNFDAITEEEKEELFKKIMAFRNTN